MKKLLALVLILGMASLANAAMDLEISIDGNLDPVDSEIELLPSETAILNIHSPTGYVVGDDVYFSLVVDTGYGNISGGVVTEFAPSDSALFGDDAAGAGLATLPENGIWGSLTSIAGTAAAPGVYVDEVLFHCVGEGDAIIHLYTTVDFVDFVLEDTAIIHQVPEPMTLSLLGLGGLGLLRRRRA